MVIGGSLGQLGGLPAGADVEAEAVCDGASEEESDGEGESGLEPGLETLVPGEAEDAAAGLTVPVEAQPDKSNPVTAMPMPMPTLRRRGMSTAAGYRNEPVSEL
jgi:hypothetical protein